MKLNSNLESIRKTVSLNELYRMHRLAYLTRIILSSRKERKTSHTVDCIYFTLFAFREREVCLDS